MPSACNDGRLLLVIAGVEGLVGDSSKTRAEALGVLDTSGTYEHRPPSAVDVADLINDSLLLFPLRGKENIRMIDPDQRAVSGDDLDFQAVDRREFLGLCSCGTCHSAELRKKSDQALQRDRPEHPSLCLQ